MISRDRPLILGSASPRRRDILGGLGIAVHVAPADVLEDALPNEPPLPYVERITRAKLAAVAANIRISNFAGVLVADTVVVIDDSILGKPVDVADAVRLLSRLAGQTHTVYTRYAISLASSPTEPAVERVVSTQVSLRHATPAEISAYARTGEGLDKAGAYAAQGIGAFLVERIEGSYTNVVGLPACEVVLDLRHVGLLDGFPS